MSNHLPDQDWLWDAACASPAINPDIFFLPNIEDAAHAISICRRCPVMSPCLQWGLNNLEYGTYGGTGEKERAALAQRIQLDKNRTRKHPLA